MSGREGMLRAVSRLGFNKTRTQTIPEIADERLEFNKLIHTRGTTKSMHSRLQGLIAAHTDFRDRIDEQARRDWVIDTSFFALVLVQMFTYAFNTYKAIGLLLPDLYYEQSSSLLRTLWEVSLDLHWIAVNPEERSARFLNFTVLEYRKSLQTSVRKARKKNRHEEIARLEQHISLLDQFAANILGQYAFVNKRGRVQFVSEFSGRTPDAIAQELGNDWLEEYDRIYKLTCAYVHGAPGAILFPMRLPQAHEQPSTIDDEARTAKVLVWSIAIMAKVYVLLCGNAGLDDTEYLDALAQRVPYRHAFRQF